MDHHPTAEHHDAHEETHTTAGESHTHGHPTPEVNNADTHHQETPVVAETHHTKAAIETIIPLGVPADKRLSAKEVAKGIAKDTKSIALAILDFGKELVGHVNHTVHDIKEVPGIAGKTTLSLASLIKLPLDSAVSVLEMFVKQGQSIGNMIAHTTAWKRLPAPVVNFVRAPFKAIGWIMGSSQPKSVSPTNHH